MGPGAGPKPWLLGSIMGLWLRSNSMYTVRLITVVRQTHEHHRPVLNIFWVLKNVDIWRSGLERDLLNDVNNRNYLFNDAASFYTKVLSKIMYSQYITLKNQNLNWDFNLFVFVRLCSSLFVFVRRCSSLFAGEQRRGRTNKDEVRCGSKS